MSTIPFKQFEDIAKQAGLDMRQQSSFWRLTAKGNDQNRIYVADTAQVSRVHFTGFTLQHPAVHILTEEERRERKHGRVAATLDFEKSEDQILEAFKTGVTKLQELAQSGETEVESRQGRNSGGGQGRRGTEGEGASAGETGRQGRRSEVSQKNFLDLELSGDESVEELQDIAEEHMERARDALRKAKEKSHRAFEELGIGSGMTRMGRDEDRGGRDNNRGGRGESENGGNRGGQQEDRQQPHA